MQHNPETPLSKTIALRVPVDQIDFLRDQAKLNERTVSGEIRRLIREYQEASDERAAA